MKPIVFLLLCALTCSSCALFKSEPASTTDATPPPGYNPVYVTNVTTITAAPTHHPAFYLSRVEANEPNRIRLFSHIVDSNGTYLSGAASTKLRSIWCTIIDHCGDRNDNITNFKIHEITENDHVPTAIALVMDHSGSMGEARAVAVQDAAMKFIMAKHPEDALALIKYDGHVGIESDLSKDPNELQQRLQRTGLTGYGGYTAIGDAIDAGITLLSHTNAYERKAVVVFTDGLDNSSHIERDSVIHSARLNDIAVCAVDFGDNIDPIYMNAVAGETGGIHEQVYRTAEFNDVFSDLYHKLKNCYVIDYVPRAYGVHTVGIKLCLANDTAYAERTFDNSPKIGEVAFLDVTFAVDHSDLLSTSDEALVNAEYLLKAFPAMTIELRGHTDNTGDSQHNRDLSEHRASAVKAALVKRGIGASRITAIGLGDSQPIAENTTVEGRAKNRRTEFVILSK